MGLSKAEAIENDRKFMDKVFEHVKATGGEYCGPHCDLCNTYGDVMRDEEEG